MNVGLLQTFYIWQVSEAIDLQSSQQQLAVQIAAASCAVIDDPACQHLTLCLFW